MRANVGDLERLLLRQIVMRDVSTRDPSVEVLGQRLALPVILAPGRARRDVRPRVRRCRPRARRSAPACRSSSRPSRSAASRRSPGRTSSAALVSALRDARPRLRRGADGARAGRRLPGAGADRRPRGGRRPPPGHAQRDGGQAIDAGPRLAAGLDLDLATRAGSATCPIGGKPLTFGNLEKAVPGATQPRTPSASGSTRSSTPASPGTTSPGCASTGPGGSWSRASSTPRTRGGRSTWASTAWSSPTTAAASSTPCRRPSARLPAVVDADRRPGRGARRRRRAHRARRRQDDRARRQGRADRARVGVGGGGGRGESGVRHVLAIMQADIDVALGPDRPHLDRRRRPVGAVPLGRAGRVLNEHGGAAARRPRRTRVPLLRP